MRCAALLLLLLALSACQNWRLPSSKQVEGVFAPAAPSAMLREPGPENVPVFSAATSNWRELCDQCHRGPDYSSHTILNWGHKRQCLAQSSCAGCHGTNLHRMDVRGNKRMCFDCHLARRLSVDCGTCHVPGWQEQHSPHGAEFARAHGAPAKADPAACLRCHGSETWCTACHGLPMPHPADILQEHPGLVRGKPETCAKCHGARPCETCHNARGVKLQ